MIAGSRHIIDELLIELKTQVIYHFLTTRNVISAAGWRVGGAGGAGWCGQHGAVRGVKYREK